MYYNYYLYRHIRLDTGLPFYIGIGTKCKNFATYETEYKRAFSKNCRSKYWKNITSKFNYTVEILFESNDFSIISDKEKEFIKLYGRKDLGKGILINLTDGGEGIPGRINSKETREKMSLSAKLRVSNELRKRLIPYGYLGSIVSKKKVKQLDMNNNIINIFDSLTTAAKETNSHISKISLCINGKRKSTKGFKWEYQF